MNFEIPELELQHELQRFATRFVERIAQATEVLQASPRAAVREEALRKHLLYTSSALEIATGPAPEVNLLDMFVFVRLARVLLEQHWIPALYGNAGRELLEAFATSEQELAVVAERGLGTQRRTQLANVVDAWLAAHPRQVRVEGIRLADFATLAGNAAADRTLQASGLLSSVRTATQATNQAMLLAERGMFLLHRMPSVWRLQVRLGVRELAGDTRRSAMPQLAMVARRGAMIAGVVGIAWAVRRLTAA
jgi:hypothetical protein